MVDKRETGGKSPVIELEGLKRGMTALEEEGIEIEEAVTDAHPSITKHVNFIEI